MLAFRKVVLRLMICDRVKILSLVLFLYCMTECVLAQQPSDTAKTDDVADTSQIYRELMTKWDADCASIVTFEVQYRRCMLAYNNLKIFTAADVVRLVEKLDESESNTFFDAFFDHFIDLESDKPVEGSTQTLQTLKDRTVSRNTFRFSGKKRWEKSVHPGGFVFNGKLVNDFFDINYTDSEKYIMYSPFNKDLKIGNIANFRLLFAYTTDFLQIPYTRSLWGEPTVTVSNKDRNLVTIQTSCETYQVEHSRGIVLSKVAVIDGEIWEQLFNFDFFSPVKDLWLPRVVLQIKYAQRKHFDQEYHKDDFPPYTVDFHTIEDIKINEPLPESAFYVPAAKGTVVWDYRDDVNDPMLDQALEDVEDVVSWFDLRNRQVYEAVPAKRNWLLYAVNIAVIVVILLLFYAKRSRKN
jgi:hypothetical protein